jgi:hypothetical protein
MPCFSKPIPYVRGNCSWAELGDVKNHSNRLSSEYTKQSNAIMERLEKMETRLNDRLDKVWKEGWMMSRSKRLRASRVVLGRRS